MRQACSSSTAHVLLSAARKHIRRWRQCRARHASIVFGPKKHASGPPVAVPEG